MIASMSFAAKLLDWLLAPVLFLWFASVAVTNFMAIDTVNAPFDKRLDDLAHALALYAHASDGKPRFDLPIASANLLLADSQDDVHYAVRAGNGTVLAGNRDLPPPLGETKAGATRFSSGLLGGEEIRVASLAVVPPGAALAEPVIVQVAETLNKRRNLASEIHSHVILPQLLVLVGALLLVWYGLTYVMSPLKRLKQEIDARDSHDLAPFDTDETPREILPLIESFNDLMQRLDANIKAQQRFIADAAHQLRTPLAGLKSQTELALRQTDPSAVQHALRHLAASSEHTIHLANQLLSMARAGTSGASGRLDALSLNDLARRTTEQWVPSAMERKIDLGFEPAADAPTVRGDPMLLGELLNNLVDNALRYTPSGGQVNVRVGGGAQPGVRVEDTGIGIPQSERELVFEPFYRVLDATLVADTPGSGLGLAIVREIAALHGATVSLSAPAEGSGTVVQVSFA